MKLETVSSELSQSQAEMEARLKADYERQISQVSQELEQFKAYAALTYATKEELQQLALSVESLKTVTEFLNMKSTVIMMS